MAAPRLTPDEKSEKRRERQRRYYLAHKEEQDIKAKARAATKRTAAKIIALRKESRYWHETHHMADSRVRELNTRLITMRTEMGDLQQSVEYLKTISLQKPHSERLSEILEEVESDMSSLAEDIGRTNRRFQHYKYRKDIAKTERNRVDREVALRQKLLDEHTQQERRDLDLLAAANELSEGDDSEEGDPSHQAQDESAPNCAAEARDRTTGLDEEGVLISESLGLARVHRVDEEWRRFEQLTKDGMNPVMPGTGGTYGAEEDDEIVTPVHDSYMNAEDM